MKRPCVSLDAAPGLQLLSVHLSAMPEGQHGDGAGAEAGTLWEVTNTSVSAKN